MEVITDKDILIRDSLFSPYSGGNEAYYYKQPDGKFMYKVWIYLDGKDTFQVDSVIYRLHPTFREPVKKINRTPANPNCSLAIWTWGIFDLEVQILLKSGEKILVRHPMTYGHQIAKGNIKFIDADATGTNPYKF